MAGPVGTECCIHSLPQWSVWARNSGDPAGWGGWCTFSWGINLVGKSAVGMCANLGIVVRGVAVLEFAESSRIICVVDALGVGTEGYPRLLGPFLRPKGSIRTQLTVCPAIPVPCKTPMLISRLSWASWA